jgi:glycosyltransferase involved in cell wall biosynthesis
MSLEQPLVSVCLPVYNGETYIAQAIASVLKQTVTDLELIVSDNASTDDTGVICRQVAEQQQRVRYHRAPKNLGLARNFNRAAGLARGRYLMWIGHDDVLEPEYIGRCLEVLENDPRLVLCFANGNHIDTKGNITRRVEAENDGEAQRPSERFRRIIRLEHWCDAIFGLMRKDAVDRTLLHQGFAGSDRVLLAELGLLGRFGHVPQHLFSRRVHAQATTWRAVDLRERSIIFDPANEHKFVFPFCQVAIGYVHAIRSAGLPRGERQCCYRYLFRWMWTWRGLLTHDVREELACALKRYLPASQINLLKAARRRLFAH